MTGAIRFGTRGAALLRPGAGDRPPGQRSLLDDIAVRRPWNVRVKGERFRARRRLDNLVPGVTVVLVNWNTREVTADTLRAVQRLSPIGTRVLVVDNGSTDGSKDMLRGWPGLETVFLTANAGHGVALDIGVCSTRTSVAVTLDSDAIPLSRDWLDQAVKPILLGQAVLSGVRSRRNFVHPVYLAVDVRTFVCRNLSFQVHRSPAATPGGERWGVDAWDTGELMTSHLESTEVAFVERTDNSVEGLPGMTAGGVVYHHGGVSRTSDGHLTAEALSAWRAACRALGADVEEPAMRRGFGR